MSNIRNSNISEAWKGCGLVGTEVSGNRREAAECGFAVKSAEGGAPALLVSQATV